VKSEISWRNKKGHRGEYETIVLVRTYFTPILKAEKEAKYRARNKQATRQEIKVGEEYKT
jgi:hypothetical protein